MGKTEAESFENAWKADSESAFGGVIAISGHVDAPLAQRITESFFEIVCAESFGVEAREVFQAKKNLRLLHLPSISELKDSQKPFIDIRKLTGAYLVQDSDYLGLFNDYVLGPDIQCVTKKKPSEQEMKALGFAWVVVKNVKSNAVVIANDKQTLGIGCGDVNRKFASHAAVERALTFDSDLKVCASDGFFPFPDNIEVLKDAGVSAIVQPGGSIRDELVIEACNKYNIAMLFTKIRHFRH